MVWTKDKPTKSGYYWVRKYSLDKEQEIREEPEMVHRSEVYFGEEPSFSFTGNDMTFYITQGEFYGPLEPPKENK